MKASIHARQGIATKASCEDSPQSLLLHKLDELVS